MGLEFEVRLHRRVGDRTLSLEDVLNDLAKVSGLEVVRRDGGMLSLRLSSTPPTSRWPESVTIDADPTRIYLVFHLGGPHCRRLIDALKSSLDSHGIRATVTEL